MEYFYENIYTFLHNYIYIHIPLHQRGLTFNLLINLIIFIYTVYVIYHTKSTIKRRIKISKLFELFCSVAMLLIKRNKLTLNQTNITLHNHSDISLNSKLYVIHSYVTYGNKTMVHAENNYLLRGEIFFQLKVLLAKKNMLLK